MSVELVGAWERSEGTLGQLQAQFKGGQLLLASRRGLRKKGRGGGGWGVGVMGSRGRGERGRGAAPHHARLGHLLPEMADGALQVFSRLPLLAQLLLQLVPVRLGLLQPLPQLRQLWGGKGGQSQRTNMSSPGARSK